MYLCLHQLVLSLLAVRLCRQDRDASSNRADDLKSVDDAPSCLRPVDAAIHRRGNEPVPCQLRARFQKALAAGALQSQPRAFVPILLGLDRSNYQLTGHAPNRGVQRLPSLRRTPPRTDFDTDPGESGQ